MALSIVHGPPNSGRAGVIRERFTAALGRDPVLVVPTYDDVIWFGRELTGKEGAVLGGEITTFRGLFREVAAATGAVIKPELTAAQRLRLFAAAVDRARPRLLRASSERPGFGPAIEQLVSELQAGEVSPAALAEGGVELGDSALLAEVSDIYAAYIALRDEGGSGDVFETAARATAALRADSDAWRSRPVFLYGFDDLTEQQLSLVRTLAAGTDVTAAVTFEERDALDARSELIERLRDVTPRDAARDTATQPSAANTPSTLLHSLERDFLVDGAERHLPESSLRFLRAAGERAEAEAVGGEIAKLLAAGEDADSIAVIVRDARARGPLLGRVLGSYGIPVAVEADMPVTATATGSALVGLLRASRADGRASDLLAFLRAPGQGRGASVDSLERRLRRDARTDRIAAQEEWEKLGGGEITALTALRDAGDDRGKVLRIAAETARDLAEWPLALAGRKGEQASASEAIELRAGAAIAAALGEIAELETCRPDPRELPALIEGLTFPLWSGPATGRVRIASPYALRAARFRHVFVVSLQDGEFPSHRTAGPFLSDEQRAAAGLRPRVDSEAEERYLFHVCLALPTHTLYLSHRYCDDEGRTAAPSPYLDEVAALLDTGADAADPLAPLYETRSLADVVFAPSEAPCVAELARSLSTLKLTDAPAALGLSDETAVQIGASLVEADAYDPAPGPLTDEAVLSALRERRAYGGTTIEEFGRCSYRWFVGHELRPGLIDPAPDQLAYGSAIHTALEAIYRDPPADGSRPTGATVEAWVDRGRELLTDELGTLPGSSAAARIGRRRLLGLIEDYLRRDARRDDAFEPAVFEGAFGIDREGVESRKALDFGEWELHGSIDRIDVDPTRGLAIVHDYKVGGTVFAQGRFARDRKVQIPLYLIAVERLWGHVPVAGLYHPLGKGLRAKPRGLGKRSERGEDLEALGLAVRDWVPDEAFDERLAEAEELAGSIVRRMRDGDITRDPLEGKCPRFCTFAPICRLDRRAESSGEHAGRDQAGE